MTSSEAFQRSHCDFKNFSLMIIIKAELVEMLMKFDCWEGEIKCVQDRKMRMNLKRWYHNDACLEFHILKGEVWP